MTAQRNVGGPAPNGSGKRYAGGLAITFVAILAVSVAPLYLLYRNGTVVAAEDLFGTAFAGGAATSAASPLRESPPIRPEQAPALRTGAVTAARGGGSGDALSPSDSLSPSDAVGATPEAPAAIAPPARDTLLERARTHVGAEDWTAALQLYERLARQRPTDATVAIERARVLAWSGNPEAAATAMVPLAAAPGATPQLRLERARYLWWAGLIEEAEALLTDIIAAGGAPADAEELRFTVRAALSPSVAVARRWLAERATPLSHLWLARALVRDGAQAEALSHLRRAIDGGGTPRDTLLLELASVALSADSMRAAAGALEVYLREFDATDRSVRLRMARAYAWSGATRPAIDLITALLDEAAEPQLYHERARLYTAAGDLERAEADLRRYLALAPGEPDALALLADIVGWRTPPVADATVPTRRPTMWRVESEAFGDSESFRWYAIEAHRQWATGRSALGETAVGVTLRHEQLQGVAGQAASERAESFGLAGDGQLRIAERLTATAGLGLRYYTSAGALPTWTLGIERRAEDGTLLLVCYEREPAVRRATTAAALEARVVSNRLRAAGETRVGDWAAAGQLEGEHLGSALGSSRRLSASAWLGRSLAGGLSGSAGVGVITTAGDAPQLAGWGPLYWMPRYYVAPSLSLRYQTTLSERWTAAARVAPSYAIVAERDDAERRFPASRFAATALGLDVDYAHPAWRVGVSADWSGAVESGYRAAVLRVRITPGQMQP